MPYSLHSNFRELEEFVRSIAPARIVPIVRSTNKRDQVDSEFDERERGDWKNVYEMASVQQKGLQLLAKYSSELSEDFSKIMLDVNVQRRANELLGVRKSDDRKAGPARDKPRDSKESFEASKKNKKGAQLSVNVDQEEIARLRQMLSAAIEKGQHKKEQEALNQQVITV